MSPRPADLPVYRADRRNAARDAGALSAWRNKPRVRAQGVPAGVRHTTIVGVDGLPARGRPYRVFTYVVGA